MTTIGLFGREFGSEFSIPVQNLINALSTSRYRIRIHSDFLKYLNSRVTLPEDHEVFHNHEDLGKIEFMISIGGDGTILSSVRVIRDTGIPVLGVNTGRLGFLSHVSLDNLEKTILQLKEKKYSLDARSLISVSCDNNELGDFNFALNEVTLHKKDTASMISVQAWVDDIFVNAYWADGLIVSTPTGSTAYSLSCGGPIVMPGSQNLVLTPIAPHNLNVRPLVIPNNKKMKLKAEVREQEMLITLDSNSFALDPQTVISLSLAPFEFNLLKFEDQNFFGTIRQKMMWGIDKRN